MTDVVDFSLSLLQLSATLLTNSSSRSVVWRFTHAHTHFLLTTHHSRVTHLWDPMHYTGCHVLHWGPGAGHRSMAVIREGNYTHNLFNGSQVQQRREAHKDPDQGGLLLHRREQEVQEHISESVLFFKFHHCNS